MKMQIPLFWPHIPRTRILREIDDSLKGRWLGQGPKVEKFEREFGKKLGYKYPLFVNSGTSAIELAYHLIGIGKGDEVIVPVLNCTAGQTGLLRRGAKIVFADIEKDTLNLDPIDLAKKISPKTKAIVSVHLGGLPAHPAVYALAKKHGIPVIVDLAQDMWPGIGNQGDYLVYSFQAIKHITTADGGMLVVRKKVEYDRAKKLRWFGIDRDLKNRKNFQAWAKRQMTFDIEEAGYKYQPTDIDASFGLAALPDLESVVTYRQRLVAEYRKELKGIPGVDIVAGGSCWLMTVLVDDRDELAERLTKLGIDNNLVHLRNDIYKIFGGKRNALPNMAWVEPRYLCLPLNPKVTVNNVRQICSEFRRFYGSR